MQRPGWRQHHEQPARARPGSAAPARGRSRHESTASTSNRSASGCDVTGSSAFRTIGNEQRGKGGGPDAIGAVVVITRDSARDADPAISPRSGSYRTARDRGDGRGAGLRPARDEPRPRGLTPEPDRNGAVRPVRRLCRQDAQSASGTARATHEADSLGKWVIRLRPACLE